MNFHQIEKRLKHLLLVKHDRQSKCICKKQIEEGRQAYVVCPLVEENEEMDLKSVEKLYEMYSKEIFHNIE